MIFNLSNSGNYRTYFETVAEESVHLGGFLYGDIEIGQEEAASWQGLKLWAWPANRGRITEPLSDNFILGREANIWIGGPCSSEKHEDENAFYDNCEAIAKKIFSRLIKDKYDGILSLSFAGVQFQRADMYPSSTKMIGCEMILTIHDPDGFEYDEDDWNIEP